MQLNAVEKRREKRREWRPDSDADMFELRSPSGELYARLFYQNMLEYGEEEGYNMFLRAVADRSAEKSPSR